MRVPLKIDDDVYVEKNTSTALKISILRRIFVLFHADPMDLVFYHVIRNRIRLPTKSLRSQKRYWTYALQSYRKQIVEMEASELQSEYVKYDEWLFWDRGFCVSCAQWDGARIDFYLGKGNTDENKKAFDYLKSRQDEIEDGIGDVLSWNRA
ncbi:MAG: DUF4268 domain-containing protein [bacterium LCO1.1]|uniref:DUF4268 domain-containing protein n=1 Tax=Candidatus Weimeria bifida TaxID=2599074 RepID=A0A6N7J1H7_9FIRM|nr:DUF4268 domain-containing protein [Candidatus Weimeria bifida]